MDNCLTTILIGVSSVSENPKRRSYCSLKSRQTNQWVSAELAPIYGSLNTLFISACWSFLKFYLCEYIILGRILITWKKATCNLKKNEIAAV